MQLSIEQLNEALSHVSELVEPDYSERLGARNQVYLRMRQAILCGNLAPGTVLTLRSISEVMNVSVMPVREAMHVLIKEGAVEQTNSKSFSIVRLSAEEFEEVKSIRLLLEGTAITRAAKNIQPHVLERLRFYQRSMEALSLENQQDYLVENHRFHFLIYRTANMPKLLPFIEMAWLQFAPNLSYFDSPDAKEDGHQFHWQIIEGLAQNDVEKSVAALKQDIEAAANVILPHIA